MLVNILKNLFLCVISIGLCDVVYAGSWWSSPVVEEGEISPSPQVLNEDEQKFTTWMGSMEKYLNDFEKDRDYDVLTEEKDQILRLLPIVYNDEEYQKQLGLSIITASRYTVENLCEALFNQAYYGDREKISTLQTGSTYSSSIGLFLVPSNIGGKFMQLHHIKLHDDKIRMLPKSMIDFGSGSLESLSLGTNKIDFNDSTNQEVLQRLYDKSTKITSSYFESNNWPKPENYQ